MTAEPCWRTIFLRNNNNNNKFDVDKCVQYRCEQTDKEQSLV